VSSLATSIRVPRLETVGRVTQLRVAHAEWTKLHSLRSSRWSTLLAVVFTIGLPALFAAVVASRWGHMSPHERADRHPLDVALAGINISQLPIAVLGVLVITGEYATGTIRASLTAVPKRLPMLWAKIGVYAIFSFALMLPSTIAAFFLSQAILRHHHILEISFSHPGVARSVIGGAVFLMLVGIFALALGAIVRSTAGGIGIFAAIFFVIPPLLNVLPTSWNNAINPWLPSSAARSIFSLTTDPHALRPGPGAALFVGYVAVAVAIAAVALVRRDA
jgi:ABC-type transport system involved in multi-copper enzyme maturation permease subunit